MKEVIIAGKYKTSILKQYSFFIHNLQAICSGRPFFEHKNRFSIYCQSYTLTKLNGGITNGELERRS